MCHLQFYHLTNSQQLNSTQDLKIDMNGVLRLLRLYISNSATNLSPLGRAKHYEAFLLLKSWFLPHQESSLTFLNLRQLKVTNAAPVEVGRGRNVAGWE